MGPESLPRDTPREAAVMTRRGTEPAYPSRRDWLEAALALAATLPLALAPPRVVAAEGEPTALARVRARGRLVVGLYQDLPPFHVAGAGIDVALGRALARALGVEMTDKALFKISREFFKARERQQNSRKNIEMTK